MSIILALGEEQFKSAAAEAAVLELRVRLLGGVVPKVSEMKIDETMSVICSGIIEHFQADLPEADVSLLRKACRIRNKLLHCEFSSARNALNEIDPKQRSGGVVGLKVNTGDSLLDKFHGLSTGQDVGQFAVGETKTRRLHDIAAWFLESTAAGVFKKAIAVLDRLLEIKSNREREQT